MEKIELEERIIEVLRTVYDPEIPVNIYDLGLIYRIELNDELTELSVDMTRPISSWRMYGRNSRQYKACRRWT